MRRPRSSRCSALELTAADLAALWRRTEGWAAAVRLAAVSLEQHPDPRGFIEHFAGTHMTISDYLVSEVLARQPPELRDFLLRTSVVDTLSADLADALTGSTDGQASLARLEQRGVLTTPLDEHGTWHRYHPLFAELLRAELRSQRPGEVRELHARAARWLAGHGDIAAAMRHAAAADAWDVAAELTKTQWLHLMIDGEMGALRPALDAMPRERVDASPELALAFAGTYLARGDRASAAPLLRRAQEGAAEVPDERRSQFAASIAAVSLYEGRMRGDLESSLEAARDLLESPAMLEDGEVTDPVRAFVLAQLGIVELWAGDLEAATGHLERAHATARDAGHDWIALAAGTHLAIARTFRGELPRALAQAERSVALAERRGWARSGPAGGAYGVLAWVAIQRGQLDDAEDLLARADDALSNGRERPLRAAHALNRALLASDRGDPDVALGILQAAREELGEWPLLPQLRDAIVAQEGLLRAAVGERELGRRLLERAERESATSLAVANALATLRLVERDPAAARTILAPHLETNGDDWGVRAPLSMRAEAWLLDALACDGLAEHDDAARSLERSLDIADPAGLQRMIVTHAPAVVPVLHRHAQRGTSHPAMVARALETIERRGREGTRPATLLLAEPLSEREQAILRYLPTMMSNQEIAGELFVSVNTIKTHLKAIYRKLDAPGRREAVQRARDLGLVPVGALSPARWAAGAPRRARGPATAPGATARAARPGRGPGRAGPSRPAPRRSRGHRTSRGPRHSHDRGCESRSAGQPRTTTLARLAPRGVIHRHPLGVITHPIACSRCRFRPPRQTRSWTKGASPSGSPTRAMGSPGYASSPIAASRPRATGSPARATAGRSPSTRRRSTASSTPSSSSSRAAGARW